MNLEWINQLDEMLAYASVSGSEQAYAKSLYALYETYADEIVCDNLGSMFALKKSKQKQAKKVMVCAHMDEAGLIVQGIHKNGLLSFIKVGPIEDHSLPYQKVEIHSDSNKYIGTIVIDVEQSKQVNKKNLKIDLGCQSKEEVEALGIRVGDCVVFSSACCVVQDKQVISRGLENRLGCILGLELLKAVKDVELDFDLYVGASVLKEVGMRGATTATNKINPDLGIVLDCDHAHDIDGASDANGRLHAGVLLRYYDKGMMPNRSLLYAFESLCKQHQIAYQHYFSMGQNDSAWIHKLNCGCPTLNIGVCVRNLYTANAVVSISDYQAAKCSLIQFIKEVCDERIQAWKENNR